MNLSQHATVHLFGCRVLLNLITSDPIPKEGQGYSEYGDIRGVILERGGPGVLRRVTRSHRDDKHIQHTVSLLLSLLLQFTHQGWREAEEEQEQCMGELEQAQELLCRAGDGLHNSQISYQRVEAELVQRIEELETSLKQKNTVLDNRESTIEQLQRRLEHAVPGSAQQDSSLELENKELKTTLERERELWERQQADLTGSLQHSQELVKEMTAALRVVKTELEGGEVADTKKVEYNTWGAVKDELDRMTKSLFTLGRVAEEELMYRYDMVDVAGEEDRLLQKTVNSITNTGEKTEVLRKFERTHSQTSLDLSVDTEQKANKTLDKLQMVRKAIHGVEQCLEEEEEKLEELRKRRFVTPLQNIAEAKPRDVAPDIDIHNMPRGLFKHICRMLEEAPECAWRRLVPLVGMCHRLKEIETTHDSPTAELIRMWTSENKQATFSDLVEVLREAEQGQVVEFIKRHLQLKKRLSKQSFLFTVEQSPEKEK